MRTRAASSPRRLLAAALAACLFATLTHAQEALTPASEPASEASLPSLDLVLSHYDEPLANVTAFVARAAASLPHARLARVFLYSHAPAGTISPESIPQDWILFHSENAGRESHNYLTFLTHHAGNTSDLVWFSHALLDHYMTDKVWPRLSLITRRTGMLGLSIIERCDCDGGAYPKLGTLLREVHAMALGQFCGAGGTPSAPGVAKGAPHAWTCFFNGEFVVSKRRIAAQPHRLYTYLRDALRAPPSHWLHMAYEEGRVSTVSNPTMGFVMERSWNLLFKCLRMEKEVCCQGSVACEAGMCQCEDREEGEGRREGEEGVHAVVVVAAEG
jgi:hypothetical protein